MKPSNVVQFRTIRSRVLTDLARSKLTADDAKKMRVEPLKAEEVQAIIDPKVPGTFNAAAYRIPYFDIAGGVSEFFRLRFLDEVKFKKKGGAALPKAQRYWQPVGTIPRAYFPPFADWNQIARDTNVPIAITEGEKKAAVATKMGFPTIGLGGVWSWQSKRLRFSLIPDLELLKMVDRSVYLVFDTDPDPKPEVTGALEALGHTLESKGAIVRQIRLPAGAPGEKVGLDDYLKAHGMDALRELKVDELSMGEALLALNHELAIIENPPGIYHHGSERLYTSPVQLSTTSYASRLIKKVNRAGEFVDANALVEWTKWPRQTKHSRLVYEPGKDRVLDDNSLNTWHGWGVQPKRGDVGPFRRLIDQAFAGSDENREWFLRWLAYPLQHPGAKMYAATVLWSSRQGTGKSLMGYTMGRIYGRNFGVVGEAELHGAFNDWQTGRQFILGEEVTGSDRRAEADRLKKTITGEKVRVNLKYQQPYDVRDCVNYLFTTNHPDAFLLDRHDRRYFVHEMAAGAELTLTEAWFTRVYDPWYRSDEGAAALHHWLLQVDTRGFEAKSRPPATQAREEMVEVSGSETDFAVRELLAAPDRWLRVGEGVIPRDLFTLDELVGLMDPDGRQRIGKAALAKALKRMNVKPMATRIGTGVVKLVSVRNPERWRTAEHAERVANYTGEPQKKDRKEPKF